MSILDNVKHYYEQHGIAARDFRCTHLADCRRDYQGFTEAREPFIGSEYERGEVPRLLFLSLDPGSSDAEPEARTAEAARMWEEESCDVHSLHKGKHWYRTHELALTLLQQFEPGITLENVHRFFAHTNSAKCCMNKDQRAMADWRMFKNCRSHVGGELAFLRPDVLVTQGDHAKRAVEGSYQADVRGNMKGSGYATIRVGSQLVLWLHTYHPRYYGGFNRQRRDSYPIWTAVVRDFMADNPRIQAATD